ncbi:hypothetical protein L0222_03420 [bacterium]|nr:hypothetical protein [bacterium]
MLTQGPSTVLAFTRTNSVETVVVVHNLGDSFVTAGPLAVTAVRLEAVFTDGNPANPPVRQVAGLSRCRLTQPECGDCSNKDRFLLRYQKK